MSRVCISMPSRSRCSRIVEAVNRCGLPDGYCTLEFEPEQSERRGPNLREAAVRPERRIALNAHQRRSVRRRADIPARRGRLIASHSS